MLHYIKRFMTPRARRVGRRYRIIAQTALSVVAVTIAGVTPALAQTQSSAKNSASNQRAEVSQSGTKAVRTLEDINIEGEIAVPQVLFITSRDNRRYRDNLGAQYRMTAMDVARSVDLPTRLRIVAKHKEEGK